MREKDLRKRNRDFLIFLPAVKGIASPTTLDNELLEHKDLALVNSVPTEANIK